MRVLLFAFACAPNAGSEPGAGWTALTAAAESCEVTLVTRRVPDNEASVWEDWAETLNGVEVIRIGVPPRAYDRGFSKLFVYFEYFWWVFAAGREGRRRMSQGKADVAHHVTYASDWLPSPLWLCPGPRVWGPVGGRTSVPFSVLAKILPNRRVPGEAVRGIVGLIGRYLNSIFLDRDSTLVVAQNQDTGSYFEARGYRAEIEPNVSIDMKAVSSAIFDQSGSGLQSHPNLLFVGRLLAWKGVYVALNVLNEIPDAHLTFIGDGPEESRLITRCEDLGLTDRVVFGGSLERSEVFRKMRESTALLFPSFHDSAGWVVAEAVAIGLPVVCIDVGGPTLLRAEQGPIGGAVALLPLSDLPSRLAARIPADGTRCSPNNRWSSDRFGKLQSGWYRFCLQNLQKGNAS